MRSAGVDADHLLGDLRILMAMCGIVLITTIAILILMGMLFYRQQRQQQQRDRQQDRLRLSRIFSETEL
jgi:hypothetical protein